MGLDAFLLKKIVSMLVHLVPGVPLVMLVALLLLRWTPRLATRCLWLGTLSLLVLSSPIASNAIVSNLEERYQTLQEAPVDAQVILVLGGGFQFREGRPPNSLLSATSLARVTEGIRLWRTRPEALLVTSGTGLYNQSSNAEVAALMALASAVPEDRIRRFDTAHDTDEEISLAVELMQGEGNDSGSTLVVVSSATHLARADQLLSYYDVEYALAPTDYIATDMPWYRLSANQLRIADRALHEYVGMLWHWIKPPAAKIH